MSKYTIIFTNVCSANKIFSIRTFTWIWWGLKWEWVLLKQEAEQKYW